MYYPAYINLKNRKCLVVGGGTVAERKVVAMLISGGNVTVISPDATELLRFLAKNDTIHWHKRNIRVGDTNGYFLVCAATDFTDINTTVFTEAHEKNNIRLVNVVDVIPQCTFAAASVVTDGDIMLSISTSGKSPATSRRIREHFEETLNTSSLYTLGYENGKPVPIENQGLPYPVYLLLENRNCVVITDENTDEIERRLSLLRQCGANVLCHAPNEVKDCNIHDAFLVIAKDKSYVDCSQWSPSDALYEIINDVGTGTHFTPQVIVDDNLIISIASKNGKDVRKEKHLYQRLIHQFENKGYGAFIELLGERRQQVLDAFPTSKMRADFFEKIIDHVSNTTTFQTCCLNLKQPKCSADCLFNWVRDSKIEHANTFITEQIKTQRANLNLN